MPIPQPKELEELRKLHASVLRASKELEEAEEKLGKASMVWFAARAAYDDAQKRIERQQQ